MSRNGRVIVAMSGGVDSSVAAALLREQGYDCVGVFLRVGAEPVETVSCALDSPRPNARRLKHGCCSATDALDARVVAGRLGIPFYALNFADDFDRIIDYFVDEYAVARTPNPCVMCNIHVKFGRLLKYADAMDAEFIATGHYARIVRESSGGDAMLSRSVNRAKDQSYVLFGIRRESLGRCLFPVGHIADKAEVRRLAAALGLETHDKPDSQEICFVPNQDHASLIRARRPDTVRSGEIRDRDGTVLGLHDGLANFTIGQRRGLGIAAGRPVFVTQLDVLSNTVHVGDAADVMHEGLLADQMNWLVRESLAGGSERRVEIKVRHMHTPAAGIIRQSAAGAVEARFDTPQLAVTPGQAAVFYDGDVVLGGGWIRESIRPRAAAHEHSPPMSRY